MADIHVLGASILSDEQTNYQYVFHIATGADGALQTLAQQDPKVSGFTSAVPGIDAGELTDIQAGVLVEETGSIVFNEGDTAGDYLARLQGAYAVRAALVSDEFVSLYRWYLNTYDAR